MSTQENALYSSYINFQSFLIKSRCQRFTDVAHREYVALYDPFGYKLTYNIAETLCSQNFKIEGVYSEKQWQERDYQSMIERILLATLIHGRCIVELFDNEPYFEVYNDKEISNVIFEKGKPISAHISFALANETVNVNKTINGKSVFFIENKYRRDRHGVSILAPIWDLLVYSRLIMENMCNYDARLGNGFPLIKKIDTNAITTPDMLSSLKSGMDQINTMRGLIAPEGWDLEFKGSQNSVDFKSHFLILTEKIAGATGFPVKFFNGQAYGAGLEASDVDAKMIRSRYQTLFGSIKFKLLTILRVLYPAITDISPTVIIDESESESLVEENTAKKNTNPAFSSKSETNSEKVMEK